MGLANSQFINRDQNYFLTFSAFVEGVLRIN